MSHDPTPAPAVPVISKTAVYTLETAAAALDLAPSCLPREIRRGRLRASRRGGKYLILGEWLLDWIAAGTPTKLRRRVVAGTNGKRGDN
jgi:hypothetical protein